MVGRNLPVSLYVLTDKYDFNLVRPLEDNGSAHLGRAGDPVDRLGQWPGAVGLDADILAGLVQAVDQFVVDPKPRLATGQDNDFGRILVDGLDNRRVLHPVSLLMASIAEITFEVTSREADKDRRRTGVESLALQAVEYLVNLSHRSPCCLRILELPP